MPYFGYVNQEVWCHILVRWIKMSDVLFLLQLPWSSLSFPVCLPSMSKHWDGATQNCYGILRALDEGDVVVLTPLGLSSAFNAIDHYIFLHRLRSLHGISGTVLSWFESYLTGRTQTVTVNDRSSRPADVSFSVPQGSVLGRILFIFYSAPLSSLIKTRSVCDQSFADDTQLLHSCPLIRTPLSWPCRHASLTWRPGWHKTNSNWMTTRQRLSL